MKLRLLSAWGPQTHPAHPHLCLLKCYRLMKCCLCEVKCPPSQVPASFSCNIKRGQDVIVQDAVEPINNSRHLSFQWRERMKTPNLFGLLLFAYVSKFSLLMWIISSWISCLTLQGDWFPHCLPPAFYCGFKHWFQTCIRKVFLSESRSYLVTTVLIKQMPHTSHGVSKNSQDCSSVPENVPFPGFRL